MDFPFLDSLFTLSLEDPFTEKEIFSALKDSDGDKAPGHDGYIFKFGQSYWHVFKEEMMTLFHVFYCSGKSDPKFSKSFIYFIPKVKSPVFLNHFRPILLLGWVYKLIAKVLTKRLKSVINQLVSQF